MNELQQAFEELKAKIASLFGVVVKDLEVELNKLENLINPPPAASEEPKETPPPPPAA